MHPELLLLSTRIAALVLVASLLAFGIAWAWQASRRRVLLRAAEQDAEQRHALEMQCADLKLNLAAAEAQCMNALEQRDEAEREAVARRNEATRLTDQITQMHATLAPREELEHLKQRLAERDAELWNPQGTSSAAAAAEALAPLQAEMESLRAGRDALPQKLAEALAPLQAEVESLRAEREALAPLQTEVESLRTERDALSQKLTESEAASMEMLEAAQREAESTRRLRSEEQQHLAAVQAEVESLRLERDALARKIDAALEALRALEAGKRASETALQARIDELQKAAPAAPLRSFTLTSPRLTAQPFLPPAPAVDDTTSSVVDTESDEMVFPPAPARSDVRDGLFRDVDISSLPPDQPSLEDVHDVLARMAAELDEKEQVLAALTQELRQREQSLTDLRSEEPGAHDKLKAAEKRAADTHKRHAHALEERDRARRHLRAVRRSIEVLESHPLAADNLTLIKGVKTVINSQLHAYGIFTYRQIVQWDEEDLQAFSELLSFKQRIWRDKWQDQARHLHEARHGERLPQPAPAPATSPR